MLYNPLRYIDPTGHFVITTGLFIGVMAAAAVIGGVASAVVQHRNTGHVDAGTVIRDAVTTSMIAGGVVLGAAIISVGVTAVVGAASTAVALINADGDGGANEMAAASDAVKAARNLVNIPQGSTALDVGQWIDDVADASIHNPGANYTVIGSYNYGVNDYISYAENAKTVVPGQGHTYFNMPPEVYDVFIKSNSNAWKAINTEFILRQIEGGSRFLLKLGPGITMDTVGPGTALEVKLLQNMGVHFHTLVSQ